MGKKYFLCRYVLSTDCTSSLRSINGLLVASGSAVYPWVRSLIPLYFLRFHFDMGVSSERSLWHFLATTLFSIFTLKARMLDYFISYGKLGTSIDFLHLLIHSPGIYQLGGVCCSRWRAVLNQEVSPFTRATGYITSATSLGSRAKLDLRPL